MEMNKDEMQIAMTALLFYATECDKAARRSGTPKDHITEFRTNELRARLLAKKCKGAYISNAAIAV